MILGCVEPKNIVSYYSIDYNQERPMPPLPRYTVRLPHALDALVQAKVRGGTPFAVLIREALSVYLADMPPTEALTVPPPPADSDDIVRGLGEQLSILRSRVEALEQVLTRRRETVDKGADRCAERPLPSADATTRGYDADAAVARIQALQAQGLSVAQITATLNQEGIPTRQGRPWHKGTVG